VPETRATIQPSRTRRKRRNLPHDLTTFTNTAKCLIPQMSIPCFCSGHPVHNYCNAVCSMVVARGSWFHFRGSIYGIPHILSDFPKIH
jgi:hypothetical protein